MKIVPHIFSLSYKATTLLLVLLVFLLMVSNMSFGTINIPFWDVLKIIYGKGCSNEVWYNIVIHTRLPQTLVALCAGMALGISGLFMQTLFRNPLAGPSVLGISSGASLGVAFIVLVAGQLFDTTIVYIGFWGEIIVILAAIVGSLIILLLVVYVSHKIQGVLGILILGVMFGYLSNSLVGIFKYYSFEEDVHSFVIWGLGSFNRLSIEKSELFLLLTIVPSFLSIFFTKPLNLLALGDNSAKSLGLNIRRARVLIILVAGLLTAFVSAFCGPIIFIGLAVPHLTKMITRTSNHFYLIINSAIIGSATALFCNIIAHVPGSDILLPINSITAFVGAPIVISVIWKRRSNYLMER